MWFMEPLIVDVEEHPRAIVIKVRGEVRLDTQPMNEAFLDAATAVPAKAVVLELSGLSFISSMGIGSIVSLRNAMKKSGRKLILAGTRPSVMDAFKRVRIAELFTATCDNLGAALAAAG
jgi:anti-sigma B factor antagonist